MNALEILEFWGFGHGVDHWDLVEYEWFEKKGVETALLTYEHDDGRTVVVQREFKVGWPDAVRTVVA